MVNEIIKERMIRSLKNGINDQYFTDNLLESMNELYITSSDNQDICIPDKYMGDSFEDSVHTKLYALYDAIRTQFGYNPFIEIKIDVDYMGYTDVILMIGTKTVYRDAIKTWNWTWETIEHLQDFMFDVYSTIQIYFKEIENQLTLDELYILHNYASKQDLCPCKFGDDCKKGIIHCGNIEDKLAHMITKMEAV